MKTILSLMAVIAVPVLLLSGCGGGYETSSGFVQGEVNISGHYVVAAKDPGIMPNLYSMQITHSGKSLYALDNLGRTWSGSMSEFALYGVYPTEAAQDTTQQTQQQQQQQQQPTVPDSYHAEVYLTMESGAGTNSLTGAIDTRVSQTTDTGDPTQPQQQTLDYTVISGMIVDSVGNSGSIVLRSAIGMEDTGQNGTTP